MKSLIALYLIVLACISAVLYQDTDFEASKVRGAAIYNDFCVTCHLAKGEGVEQTYPPLAKSDYLMNNRTASIRGIKYGQRGPMIVNGKPYDNTMIPMGLEPQEIADVMNYITTSWGNENTKMVTAAEVTSVNPR
ncbi:MAG: cytochrome c [Muriicola sp.]|nr:cytochrome c [Muriicola sp.]